jgi:uncharacterized protein YqeY
MTLKEKIIADLKEAMRSGDSVRRDTLRLLDSAIKNVEIEKKKREAGLDDAEILEVINRSVKQRQDSIRQFNEGGRPELAEKEQTELDILMPYMPAQFSENEIKIIVKEIISQMKTASIADVGKIMGQAMGKLKGKADGNLVKKIVEEELKQ